jgi:hypothetical protein
MTNNYRSGLEEKVAKELTTKGITFQYEERKVKYDVHETRTYTPDFELPNGIIIETKGRFTTYDRKKHLLIQKQHPSLDIRFVFSNPNSRLYKGSKSTYASWCDKYNFKYAKKLIPKEWINERT